VPSIKYFHQQACTHYGEDFDASEPLHAAFSMDATDVEENQQFSGDDFIGDEDHGNLAGVSGSSHAELQADFKRLAAAVRDMTSSRSCTVDTAIALETFATSVKVELDSILAAANKKLAEKRVKYRSTNESRGSSADLFGLQKTYITTYRKRVDICESAIRHLAELLAVAERRKSEGIFSDAEREEVIDSLKQIFLVRRRAATHFFSGVLQTASGKVVVPIVRLAFEQMSQDQVRALLEHAQKSVKVVTGGGTVVSVQSFDGEHSKARTGTPSSDAPFAREFIDVLVADIDGMTKLANARRYVILIDYTLQHMELPQSHKIFIQPTKPIRKEAATGSSNDDEDDDEDNDDDDDADDDDDNEDNDDGAVLLDHQQIPVQGLIGRRISKKVGEVDHEGDVTALLRVEKSESTFLVTYSDGDDEELSCADVRSRLIPQSSPFRELSSEEPDEEKTDLMNEMDKEEYAGLRSYEGYRALRMTENTAQDAARATIAATDDAAVDVADISQGERLMGAIMTNVPIVAEEKIKAIPLSTLRGADNKNREPPETSGKLFLSERQRMIATTLGRIRKSCQDHIKVE
jgi:hypothetical protein